jgi:uncharacterized protein YggE
MTERWTPAPGERHRAADKHTGRFRSGVLAHVAPRLCRRGLRPLAALVLTVATPAAAQEPQVQTIVTIGDAVIRRVPDLAFTTATVEARAKSPRDASRQAADTMTAVRQRLAAAGVPADALRTAGYDLEPEADFIEGRRVPRGYVARNTLEVRVDSIERTGEIIDAVVAAGASAVAGVRFELKDRPAAERVALRLAVGDARARAEAAAAGAGRTIDRLLRIEEVRDAPIGPRPMVALSRAVEAQAVTPVEPGAIEIRAHVVLTASFR